MTRNLRKQKKEAVVKLTPLYRNQWIKREPNTELGHRIVSATVEEFAEKGMLGARVASITNRIGTADPAFYRYFVGLKQAVLFIMSEYYWAPLNLRLTHYQKITNDPAQLFEAIVDALIFSAEDDPSRPWLAESKVFRIVVAQMRNPALLPESLLDSEYLTFIAKLEEIIQTGQGQGIFTKKLHPALIAQLLVSNLHGLLMLNTLDCQPIIVSVDNIKTVAKTIVSFNQP
ncbi:MAG: TetR/AcrR family transcriptional regulator [Acidobacteriota bacterium]